MKEEWRETVVPRVVHVWAKPTLDIFWCFWLSLRWTQILSLSSPVQSFLTRDIGWEPLLWTPWFSPDCLGMQFRLPCFFTASPSDCLLVPAEYRISSQRKFPKSIQIMHFESPFPRSSCSQWHLMTNELALSRELCKKLRFFKELEENGLVGLEHLGPQLSKAYRSLLNVLALPLSPMGSEGLLTTLSWKVVPFFVATIRIYNIKLVSFFLVSFVFVWRAYLSDVMFSNA